MGFVPENGVTTVLSNWLLSLLTSSYNSLLKLFNSCSPLSLGPDFLALPEIASESKQVLFADSFDRSLVWSRALKTPSPILLMQDLDRFFFLFFAFNSSCIFYASLSLACCSRSVLVFSSINLVSISYAFFFVTCFSVEFVFTFTFPVEAKSPSEVIWVFVFLTLLMSPPLLESIEHLTPSSDLFLFLGWLFWGELPLLYESIFASN